MATTVKKANPAGNNSADATLTAEQFLYELQQHTPRTSPEEAARFFRNDTAKDNVCIGLKMAALFALSKTFMQMSLPELGLLLDSPYYEARMGAVCIMDFQARDKKTPASRKKELYELYLRKHDRINNWDMVDRAAPYVVGGYLFDRSRKPLYQLARSRDVWERRTAIVSTYFFIRQGDTADTFKIAGLLVQDPHEMIHTAVGSWVREAGKKDPQALLDFLDHYAAGMPAIMLRYATGKLDPAQKERYRRK